MERGRGGEEGVKERGGGGEEEERDIKMLQTKR